MLIWLTRAVLHTNNRTLLDRSGSALSLLHTIEAPRVSFSVMFLGASSFFLSLSALKATSLTFNISMFFIVYDVSNRDSFNDLQTWFNELDTYCSSKEVVRMIVGNKVDKVSIPSRCLWQWYQYDIVIHRKKTTWHEFIWTDKEVFFAYYVFD